MLHYFRKLKSLMNVMVAHKVGAEQQLLMLGRLSSEALSSKKSLSSLSDVEFKVFSQWGDDGIIQWLINNLDIKNSTFIEFGVANYRESNTRFLLMNDNWSGFVIDGDKDNIRQIVESEYYWKYDLSAKAAFIDLENINMLLAPFASEHGPEIGLLHIDLDGNDYWIWKQINVVSPIVLILEYNSVFGTNRAISVPYDKSFVRGQAHFSHLYFGASLRALYELSIEKGYSFVGCNSAGNNAYFVRNDYINSIVVPISLETGFVESRFRESRGEDGQLSFLRASARLDAIRGMPVINVNDNQPEEL